MGKVTPHLIRKCYLTVYLLAIADIIMLLLAVMTALLLRFDGYSFSHIYYWYVRSHLFSLPAAILFYLAVFSIHHMYRCAWRYAGIDMLWNVISANTTGLVIMITLQSLLDERILPRSVLVIIWFTSILLTGGTRIILRVLAGARQDDFSTVPAKRSSTLKKVVIVGAGSHGARVLRTISEDPNLSYDVIGFLDEDPDKSGVYVGRAKVIGDPSLLKHLAADGAVDEVIVALPGTISSNVREAILECRRNKIPVKVIPNFSDVLAGKTSLQFADFSVEDLLRRPQASTDISVVGSYLTGKRVLVTGAGGSIGSELCRQIASLNPHTLILLGHGENSIYQSYQSLIQSYPQLSEQIHYVIASVAHEPRIRQAFEKFRPEIVFHAAAHKHVPIMELNEQEAVFNNVMGTYNVAQSCGRFGVERVTLISTDKAADPVCIMGATKWMCEEVFRAVASSFKKTSCITVRFGNVLGSRGSVVPIFQEQIKRGGPVTVTHPDMTRYFMTIPEAVRLVLQAGGIGKSGDLYLLDMGEPVRVIDLAEDMIRLNGLEPGKDIAIRFTGVRPGERLHERLTSLHESIRKTSYEGLSLVDRSNYCEPAQVMAALKRLEKAADFGTADEVRSVLNDFITRFQLHEEQNDAHTVVQKIEAVKDGLPR